MRRLLLSVAVVAGCQSATLDGPCSLTDACGEGEVCDFTAEGGATCISASGDLDGDGLPNDRDFCQHAPGGASDEDLDGIGDDCDRCPIAAPRGTPDPDGDAVDAPCDPDPREPGDEILLFDSFSALDARWKPTTPAAWEVRGGEVIANLSSVGNQEYLATTVIGRSSIAIEASYRVDRLEASATQHLVAVYAEDPRPAGVAQVQCGVTKADAGASEIVVVETNQGAMNTLVTGAFASASLYRAGAYVTGTRAGCSVIGDGAALGTVQATITADQLTAIALTARAVTARFQFILVVGR